MRLRPENQSQKRFCCLFFMLAFGPWFPTSIYFYALQILARKNLFERCLSIYLKLVAVFSCLSSRPKGEILGVQQHQKARIDALCATSGLAVPEMTRRVQYFVKCSRKTPLCACTHWAAAL